MTTPAQRGDSESPHTGVTDTDRETATKVVASVGDDYLDVQTWADRIAAALAAARADGEERIRAKVLAVLSEASERDRLGVPQLDWFDCLRAAVAPGGQR